jgi:hypothetical protein
MVFYNLNTRKMTYLLFDKIKDKRLQKAVVFLLQYKSSRDGVLKTEVK